MRLSSELESDHFRTMSACFYLYSSCRCFYYVVADQLPLSALLSIVDHTEYIGSRITLNPSPTVYFNAFCYPNAFQVSGWVSGRFSGITMWVTFVVFDMQKMLLLVPPTYIFSFGCYIFMLSQPWGSEWSYLMIILALPFGQVYIVVVWAIREWVLEFLPVLSSSSCNVAV